MPPSSRQVRSDLSTESRKLQEQSPSRSHSIGVARIVNVDYTKAQASIQVLSGEDDLFQYTSVPLTQPSAGARHFLGALPEPGDICLVSKLPDGTPAILGYLPIAQTAGREWLVTQDVLPTEIDFSPKLQYRYEGIYSRRRYKSQTLSPGNILLSSSQGSDIRIDESISISSRKLSEIQLRDSDRSTLIRSQLLHASLSGVSITSGITSRTAQLLPSRLQQNGVYTPHVAFKKSNPTSPFPDSGVEVDPNLDPYSLSPLIGVDSSISAKPSLEIANTPISTLPLPEHRIEIYPTSPNTLPPSQIIDGFAPYTKPALEIVYGTVTPNDPNDPLYGIPCSLSVNPLPSFSPSDTGDATLLRINPEDGSTPTTVAWSKTGALKAFLASSATIRAQDSISISTPNLILDTPSLSLPSLSTSPDTTSIQSSTISISSTQTTVQASQSALITARDSISIQDSNSIAVSPKQSLRLISDKINVQANTIDRTVQGKETSIYVGPKSSLPSNGPTREVTFASTPATGNLGGTVDKYSCLYGDREESFDLGNHTTSITIGDLTYRTGAGTFKAQAGISSLSISSTQGISASTTSLSLTSTTSASISSLTSTTIKSSGVSRISGSSVILSAPGNSGLILCSADKDPLSNLPFSFYGLGSPGHILAPQI